MRNFQSNVWAWLKETLPNQLCYSADERNQRFLEEALELVQSGGLSQEKVLTLVGYVYARPIGNHRQEVGGVMLTLAVLCSVAGYDMDEEGWREYFRVDDPRIQNIIRDKQKAKPKL